MKVRIFCGGGLTSILPWNLQVYQVFTEITEMCDIPLRMAMVHGNSILLLITWEQKPSARAVHRAMCPGAFIHISIFSQSSWQLFGSIGRQSKRAPLLSLVSSPCYSASLLSGNEGSGVISTHCFCQRLSSDTLNRLSLTYSIKRYYIFPRDQTCKRKSQKDSKVNSTLFLFHSSFSKTKKKSWW